MKKSNNKIFSGWMIFECGQWIRATIKPTAPDMERYLANFKARRAAQ